MLLSDPSTDSVLGGPTKHVPNPGSGITLLNPVFIYDSLFKGLYIYYFIYCFSGVEVSEHNYPTMPHGFFALWDLDVPETRHATQRAVETISTRVHWGLRTHEHV